jgi:hypothetical protein
MMIVDCGYIAQVCEYEEQPLDRRWAYVEFKLSEFYQDEVLWVGFRRWGASLPRRMTLAAPRSLGDVADTSNPASLAEALNLFFRSCLTSRRQPRLKMTWRAHIELAVSYLRDGSLKPALEAAQRVFSLEPRVAWHRIIVAQCQIELGSIAEALRLIAAPRDALPLRSALKCIMKAQVFMGLGAPDISQRRGAAYYWPHLSKTILDIFQEMLTDGTSHHNGKAYRIMRRIEADPRNYFPDNSITRVRGVDIPGPFNEFDIAIPPCSNQKPCFETISTPWF